MRGRSGFGHGRQRRGWHMLKPTLLFLMHKGATHGYDLLEQLKEYEISEIDPSLVYRAMREMEVEGMVTSTWDEKDTQGPPRRMYNLTPFGDRILQEYLNDLRNTRNHIDRLIDDYEQHMKHGNGDFHNG